MPRWRYRGRAWSVVVYDYSDCSEANCHLTGLEAVLFQVLCIA